MAMLWSWSSRTWTSRPPNRAKNCWTGGATDLWRRECRAKSGQNSASGHKKGNEGAREKEMKERRQNLCGAGAAGAGRPRGPGGTFDWPACHGVPPRGSLRCRWLVSRRTRPRVQLSRQCRRHRHDRAPQCGAPGPCVRQGRQMRGQHPDTWWPLRMTSGATFASAWCRNCVARDLHHPHEFRATRSLSVRMLTNMIANAFRLKVGFALFVNVSSLSGSRHVVGSRAQEVCGGFHHQRQLPRIL